MKIQIAILATGLLLFGCTSTPEEVEPRKTVQDDIGIVEISEAYRAPLFFFTSYRCRGCGSFGKPVTERVIEELGDTLVPMVCHFKYGDPFENQTNLDIIASQGGDLSSPQIYWDGVNEIYKLLNLGQNGSVEYLKKEARADFGKSAPIYLGMKAIQKDNGRWQVRYAVKNAMKSMATYRIEIYSNEDGLISIQKGAKEEENQIHDNVIRAGHYGNMGREVTVNGMDTFYEEVEVVPCSGCQSDDLYFTIVAWKDGENGQSEYVNGLVYRP